MTNSRLAQSRWQSLDTLFTAGALGTLPDPDLLKCFRSESGARGHEAFRVLVERHGPMVLSLCRSLIPDSHEAEDAFQATFLVLVRKGPTIWVRRFGRPLALWSRHQGCAAGAAAYDHASTIPNRHRRRRRRFENERTCN